jgi:hypothetical protein
MRRIVSVTKSRPAWLSILLDTEPSSSASTNWLRKYPSATDQPPTADSPALLAPPALDAAEAKLSDYSQLSASWLPDGAVAIFGHDQRLVRRGPYHVDERVDPFGVVLFDPEAGRGCSLDARADTVLVTDGVLLVFRAVTSGPDAGIGVVAYTPKGERLWHRLGNDAIDFVQVLNGYAYVTTSWHGWETTIMEVGTGRVVERITGRPPDLVGARSSR